MERKPLKRTPMKRGNSQLKRSELKRGNSQLKRTPLKPKSKPAESGEVLSDESTNTPKRTPMKRGKSTLKRTPLKPGNKPLNRTPLKAGESSLERGQSTLKRTPMKKGESTLKRTPLKPGEKTLKQTASAKPRKALNPISEKRKEENKIRRERMIEKFGPRKTWKCQVGHLIGTPCFGAVNGHEPKARSAGGSITDMDNVMLACNHHNEWIESHPKEAVALGLKKWSWQD